MTRIVQIRRGSATEHENFTGAPGEVTYDTDNKTLRVHDGETLGGYTLARLDQVGESTGPAPEFDINSVPEEFWQEKVTMYAPNGITIKESSLCPISSNSYMEYIFNTTAPVKLADIQLICQTPDAGYTIGDVVPAFGIGTRTAPAPVCFYDPDSLHVRLLIGGEVFWVSHKTTGITTNIQSDRWKLKFRVWC